ncbi:hypothetical protein GCM10022226_17690 [Sphaerisporangium flaviroseum]|uniref:Fibronectin type-III domain-containing protein n=1 Tax=Sphaerisporangium flaviroseum TaxID=509199 RepID=A0ABP7HQS1_9ACTN
MAGKYTIPILLAVALAGGSATGTVAMAAVATDLPALRSAGLSQLAQPDTQPPTAPSNLRYTEPARGLIRLQWDPSTDGPTYPPGPGVVAYDIYASKSPYRLIATVPGNVLTYTDRQSICITVSYFVRARDAAGNVSPPSNVVTRPGKKCVKRDDAEQVISTKPNTSQLNYETDKSHHKAEDDQEVIKANKFLHLEEGDEDGGGHHWSNHDTHGRHHHGGGHEHAGAEAEEGGGHQPAAHQAVQPAAVQHGGKQLPLTGAPVAAVAGVGGALLLAGAAGIMISVRRRRSTGAR